MERADLSGDTPPAEQASRAIALGVALVLHGLIFAVLSFVPEKPMAEPKAPISVQLVISETPASQEPDELEPEAENPAPSTPEPIPPPIELEPTTPPIETQPAPLETFPEPSEAETLPEPSPPASRPVSILSTEDDQAGDPIPDRWRLPPGARIPLDQTQQAGSPEFETLARSLDCLGFDADCAEQRKVVFSEDQLSGTDLVWMPSFAHSGLSNSDLYGLSEAEIRDRLGITTAGQNGFAILPGIVIDGPWWDALHGVNKACSYGLGTNDLGQKQLMKQCDPGRASSKDRIGFIPKPVE